MGYLSDEEAAAAYAAAKALPEVQRTITEFQEAWLAAGLPERELGTDFLGPIFLDEPEEPLLDKPGRERARDHGLWQVIFSDPDSGSLTLNTYDSEAEAEAKLNSLNEVEGDDAGGIIVKAGVVVKERLFIRYLQKEDFLEFFERACTEPEEVTGNGDEERLQAAKESLHDRLSRLTKVAPRIGELKKSYDAKDLAEPEIIYGKPSNALNEFAQLFPQYVQLGGCCMPP